MATTPDDSVTSGITAAQKQSMSARIAQEQGSDWVDDPKFSVASVPDQTNKGSAISAELKSSQGDWVDDPKFSVASVPDQTNKGSAISAELKSSQGDWVEDPQFVQPTVAQTPAAPKPSGMMDKIKQASDAIVKFAVDSIKPIKYHEGGNDWLYDSTKSETPDPNEVTPAEAAGRAYLSGQHALGKTAGMAVAAPSVAADYLKNIVSGKDDTSIQDYVFKNWVAPHDVAIQDYAIKPSEKQSFTSKVASGVGGLLADLPYMIASGGVSQEAGITAQAPAASEQVGKVISQGFDVARPLMIKAASDKAEQVLSNGGTKAEAMNSAVTSAMLTGYMMSAPMSVESNLFGRLASGAPLYASVSEASRIVQNAADPQSLYQPFNLENFGVNMATGSILAASLGHTPQENEIANTPHEQAKNDAEILNAGKEIPTTDEARVKNAALVSVMGDNKAVEHAIDSGNQSLVDQMLSVSPRASDAIAKIKAKAAEAEPTAMSEAFANAKEVKPKEQEQPAIQPAIQPAKEVPLEKTPEGQAISRRNEEVPVSQNRRTHNQAGFLLTPTDKEEVAKEFMQSQGGEYTPEMANTKPLIPETDYDSALADLKSLQEQAKPNKGQLIKAEKAVNSSKIAEASKTAAHSSENAMPLPTEAQHAAGNYPKGHVALNGLDVTIENPRGSVRTGVAEGKPWQVKMQNPYGYIRKSMGADGDHMDVYLGDHITKESPVFVVDQVDPKTKQFDEHKVIYGARGFAEAKEIYDNHFSDKTGPERRGAISKMPLDEFKTWIKGDTTEPIKYKEPAQNKQVNAAEDMLAENKALTRLAHQKGFADIADFQNNDAEEYKLATSKWRNQHPIEQFVKPKTGMEIPKVGIQEKTVEVKDKYGRTHLVRESDLNSTADRIQTIRKNGEIWNGEEIPRSILPTKTEEIKEPINVTETAKAEPQQTPQSQAPIRSAVETLVKYRRFAQQAHLGIQLDKVIVKAKAAMTSGEGDPAVFMKAAAPFKKEHPEAYNALKSIADSVNPVVKENLTTEKALSPSEKSAQKKDLVHEAKLRGLETFEKTSDELKADIASHDAKNGPLNFEQKAEEYGKAPIFYSQLAKQIDATPDRIFQTGKQVSDWLDSNAAKLGVKKDEIEATGIKDWLKLQGKVSKADVLAYLDGNGVQVEEVVLGDSATEKQPVSFDEAQRLLREDGDKWDITNQYGGRIRADRVDMMSENQQYFVRPEEGKTKFASYQLPGGENYKELLLTLPTDTSDQHLRRMELAGIDRNRPLTSSEQAEYDKLNSDKSLSAQNFKSSHYPDNLNILAHIRFNERTDATGEKVLFLEELQSDWGQKGKKEGFGPEVVPRYVVRSEDGRLLSDYATEQEAKAHVARADKSLGITYKLEDVVNARKVPVPSAPFVTDTKAWTALALKRMIRYAAENGMDKVAWTTGEQQAARYDLSKQINSAHAIANKDGTYNLTIEGKGGSEIEPYSRSGKKVTPSEMEDVIGKEIAHKLIEGADKNKDKPWPKNVKENPAFFSVRGLDLQVGGEGMKGYYDQIVPQVANDVLKKIGGGKVEDVPLAIHGEQGKWPTVKQQGFIITPEMRAKVMNEGMALFQKEEYYGKSPVQEDRRKPENQTIREATEKEYLEQEKLFKMAQEDALKQKEADYETNKENKVEPDIYEKLPVREGTTEKQKQLGRDAYRDILGPYARREGANLLGSRIAKDFKEHGGAELHGQEVKTPADFAILAQILRDPRIEKARVFYTNGDKIVGHDAYTSNQPGAVTMVHRQQGENVQQAVMRMLDTIKRQKEALGADGYWLEHNHPAGRAEPSDGDIAMTRSIALHVDGFKGHVVIDHNEYAHIDADGKFTIVQKEMPQSFTKEVYEIPHNLLNSELRKFNDAVVLSKQLEQKEGFFTMIGHDARRKVSAIAEFPTSLLNEGVVKELRLHATLRRFAAQTGSTNIVAVTGRENIQSLERLVQKGVIADVVTKEGYSARDFVKYPGKNLFGKQLALAAEQKELSTRLIKQGEEKEEPAAIDKAKTFVEKVKAGFADLAKAYAAAPEFTESKKIIGEYTGKLQEIDYSLSKLAKSINKEFPKDRQEAITNYIQAGGDEKVLHERLDKSPDQFKQGYQDALKLSQKEKELADFIQTQQDDYWKKANEAGIIEHYIENYVRGQWERENPAGQKIIALVNSGMLNDHPKEAMRKVFQNYAEGEQAGFIPTDKRIGFQFVAGNRSIRAAIAAREALTGLMHSTEKDGRPTVAVGGGGSIMEPGAEEKPYFVKPNVKPAEAFDYKTIDHPALRGWKWVGADAEGKPIMMHGQMYIHPDAYRKINALLGNSIVRNYEIPKNVPVVGGTRPGEAMLKTGAFIKSTILIGPFHQFHLGEHAVFHGVNPVNVPEIDFNERPVLREGVYHGLMLYNHNAMHEFAEGLSSGGLWHRLPVIGDGLKKYQEWLFQDYIPRLKAAMYEKAVARAEDHYAAQLQSGKLTRDQMLDNTAKQANAAFGELNYKYMARDPSYQDALRVALLAPDFLEARLKFFGQAVRPYGREQMMALIRGAAIMGLGAQTINMMFGDDNKTHWDRPFSVIIGGREYSPRSVVGDIGHLITDPRGFWFHRINPLWGRPLYELSTGRNVQGQKETVEDGIMNILKSWVPIPAQGVFKDQPEMSMTQSIVNTLLQSIGVSNFQTKSPAEKMIHDFNFDKMPQVSMTDEQIAKHRALRAIEAKLRSGEPDKAQELFTEGQAQHIVSPKDYAAVVRRSIHDPMVNAFKHLDYDQAQKVWEISSDEEKKKLQLAYNEKKISELRRRATLGENGQ